MPLINFKTNLTSLRFGMDQPGGGNSGQPFIQNPIETANTPTETKRFYELNRTSLDFPIRGGALSSSSNGTYTTQAATIDADRIKKFFNSSPRGTAFIQKQRGLQSTNPLTQVPNSLAFAGISFNSLLGLNQTGNAIIPTTQVYNPRNTLAQVAASGTGAHFNRHGVSPTIYESIKQTYQYIVGNPDNNTELTNRLTILKALKLDTSSNSLVSSNPINGISIDPELVGRLGISTIQSQLFNYPGGPGSDYGIGFTRIFRATDSQGVAISTQPVENPVTLVKYSTMALTYAQLSEQKFYRGWNNAHPYIQDFRAQLANDGHDPQVASSDYYNYSLEKKLGIGKPGAWDTRLLYNDTSKTVAQDSVNMINPFFFDPNGSDPWDAANQKGFFPNDMIKFAFECLSNDLHQGADQTSAQSTALIFRAFLEGQIQDSNQAQYNTFKYLGRGETFRTYQGFDRSISFTFKIFAQTRQEMRPLYKKLNWLISQVYPDYSPTSNLMRGNVVRMTIGDYINQMPGFLENVNVTIDNSNTPWDILLGEHDESDVRQLPHMVTVQCNFRPIMDLLPRRENYLNQFVPLIVNGDHYLDPNPPVRNLDTSIIKVGRNGIPATNTPDVLNLPPVKYDSIPNPNPKQVNAKKPKKGTDVVKPSGTGIQLSTAVGSGTFNPTTKFVPQPPPGVLTQ